MPLFVRDLSLNLSHRGTTVLILGLTNVFFITNFTVNILQEILVCYAYAIERARITALNGRH